MTSWTWREDLEPSWRRPVWWEAMTLEESVVMGLATAAILSLRPGGGAGFDVNDDIDAAMKARYLSTLPRERCSDPRGSGPPSAELGPGLGDEAGGGCGPINMTKFYVIDDAQLHALDAAAKRLHTEDRMDGDEMRDLGHALADVVRVCTEFELPPEERRSIEREPAPTGMGACARCKNKLQEKDWPACTACGHRIAPPIDPRPGVADPKVAELVLLFLRDRMAIITRPEREKVLDLARRHNITAEDLIAAALVRARNA